MEYPASRIVTDEEYYYFEFTASPDGKLHINSFTHWAGWADGDERVELREPSIVDANYLAKFWEDFQMPFHVVNTVEDYVSWFINGGHALVTKAMTSKFLSRQLEPDASVRIASHSFVSKKSLPDDIFRRAPTRKMRMAVIKRDAYKCKVCGRRPENYVDIELDVHHIRPHGLHGVTHPDNLITLCDTCHGGLDPHFDPNLFDLLESPELDVKTRTRNKYLAGVRAYRAKVSLNVRQMIMKKRSK